MPIHLSHTCKAAIKSVVFLTKLEASERASFITIAKAIEESPHTVSKLLQVLVKKGIINSAKGPTGGFYITKAQADKPLSVIVQAIDGKKETCILSDQKCNSKQPCMLHESFSNSRQVFNEIMSKNTISSISKKTIKTTN